MNTTFLKTAAAFAATLVCGLISTGAIAQKPGDSQTPKAKNQIKVQKAIIKIIESVSVPAQRTGIVHKLNVKPGHIVKKGQELALLQDKDLRIKVRKAKLEHEIAARRVKDSTLIDFAKKSAEVSKAELNRAVNANRSVDLAISDTEIDRLKLVVSKAKLEIQKATIDFDIAGITKALKGVEIEEMENELQKHIIKSPIDGLVVKVEKAAGEWTDPGEKIVRIVRINKLRIEGQIRVDLAVGIKRNQQATIEVDLPDNRKIIKQGKVVFISPEANPISRKVALWVEFDNSDGALRPGLQGNIILKTQDKADDTDSDT